MAKFINVNEDRYLNLESITYVDLSKKAVWTSEPHSKGGQCKYEFDTREDAWQDILSFLYENMYKSKKESDL